MTDRFFRFAHDRCSFLCRIAASAPAVHFLRTISRRSVQIRNPFRSGCGSAFIIPYSPKIFKSNFVVSGKAVSRRSAGACLSDTPAGEPQQGSRFLHPHFHLTKPGKRGILSCTFFSHRYFADVVKLADTIDLGSIAPACRFKSCHPHQNKTLRNDAAALFLSVSFFVPGAVLYLSFMQAVCPDLLKLSRKNGKFFL